MYTDEFGNDEDIEEEVLPSDLKRLVEAEERQILPHQETTENVNLGTEDVKREVKIGTSLSESTREELIDLLKEYVDVFAWSYQDMPGLDTDIVVHHLPLREECPPVKQKLRRVKSEMLLKIKEEVRKQLDAGFLEVSKYPE